MGIAVCRFLYFVTSWLANGPKLMHYDNLQPSQGYWDKKTTPSVVWGELRPGDRCVGFGTREYSAQLLDTTLFSNWADFCDTTQIQIYGRVYDRPERCERNVGAVGVTIFFAR